MRVVTPWTRRYVTRDVRSHCYNEILIASIWREPKESSRMKLFSDSHANVGAK